MTGLWSRYSPEKLASPAGFAEDPALAGRLRELLWQQGIMVSRVLDGKEEARVYAPENGDEWNDR